MRIFYTTLLGLFLVGCSAVGFNSEAVRTGADQSRTLGQAFADQLLKVKPEYRSLRICLLAAGVAELATDRARLFGFEDASGMLGRVEMMSSVMDNVSTVSEIWLEADMANAAFMLAQVLEQAGMERLGRVFLGGLTISNFIKTAKRGAVTTYKASAMLRDVDRMFQGLETEVYTEQQIWQACKDRISLNRSILLRLLGARSGSG